MAATGSALRGWFTAGAFKAPWGKLAGAAGCEIPKQLIEQILYSLFLIHKIPTIITICL
jgi:hypothetical protein